mgnify:CR=1 FL=1
MKRVMCLILSYIMGAAPPVAAHACARPACPLAFCAGLGDDDEGEMEAQFEQWREGLWRTLCGGEKVTGSSQEP